MPDPADELRASTGGFSARTYLAVTACLARDAGTTLETYSLSLGLLFRWCRGHGIDPGEVTRADLERFVRLHLEHERGCSAASVAHHITPVQAPSTSQSSTTSSSATPDAALRKPKVWFDPHATDHLSRAELRAMIRAARASP